MADPPLVERYVPKFPLIAFLQTVVDRLRAREELRGLSITSGPVNDEALGEYIMFVTAEDQPKYISQGRDRQEHPLVATGILLAEAPGAGEDAIRAAQNRADDFLHQVALELRGSTAGATAQTSSGTPTAQYGALVGSYSIDQGFHDGRHWCQVTFELRALHHTYR